ncbi:hypothetical protein U9M48_011972 [Paspalum notatum var. saurae]|uniref:F-box protein At3g26010-like beta-propeller domain-containing protein n=1 Tax=Paspalum notatum var. saurae TaxID=547442 RepID=A0AAQ3SZ04_PASNO
MVTDCLRKVPPTLQGLFYGPNGETFGGFFNLLGPSVPPVDPSFSFLPKMPKTHFTLMDSCNGLVLFDLTPPHLGWVVYCFNSTPGYIVCNPATKEWVAVPRSNKDFLFFDEDTMIISTPIVFDPAVSPQFELVQFLLQTGKNTGMDVFHVHTYSSESRAWSQRATECWSHDESINPGMESINGMIHFSVSVRLHSDEYENVIVAVDGRGEKRRVIRWPEGERGLLDFLGQSQGLLHCMGAHYLVPGDYTSMTKLSVWVLEDYDKEQWVQKVTVTCMQLFGEVSCLACPVTIHPDRSLALFFHLENRKLVSYDMDSKEVSALCTLDGWVPMTPYVPYFVESLALAKKR